MAVRKSNVKPNEFKGFTVKINGNDFSSLVNGIDVFQDIFTPNWTATIVLLDALNIQNSFDVAVGNTVSILIESDTATCKASKSFNFILQSISNKTLIKKDLYGYILEMIASDAIKDIKTRVQRSYKKKKCEEIVKDIIQKDLGGSVQTGNTKDKYDVIIPNMTPFTAVNFVAHFSQETNK